MPYRGFCTSNNDGNASTGTTSTFTTPGTSVAGDVVDIYLCEVAGVATINTTPANANLRAGPDASTGANFKIYRYTMTLTAPQAGGGTFSFIWSANARIIEAANVFSGCTETGVVFSANVVNSAANTTVAMPSITTSVTCDISVLAGTRVAAGAPPAISFAGGPTADHNYAETTAGANLGAACGHELAVAAGTLTGRSASFSSTPQSGGGITAFPLSAGTAWTAAPTDSIGLTDSIAVDQEKTISDDSGLTDSIAVNRGMGLSDSAGLTDSIIVDRQIVLSDSMGMSDSLIQQGSRFLTITDSMGLLDSVGTTSGSGPVVVRGGNDIIMNDLISKGYTTGTIMDRERRRLRDLLTMTDQQIVNYSLYDLYRLNGEVPRLVGMEY